MSKFLSRSATAAALLVGSLALGVNLQGCTSHALKPVGSLSEAELAYSRAEQARVGDYDAVDLHDARESLVAARAASNEKDQIPLARWLATRSKVDSELGIAQAELARLQAQTLSVQREIDAHSAPTSGVTPVPVP